MWSPGCPSLRRTPTEEALANVEKEGPKQVQCSWSSPNHQPLGPGPFHSQAPGVGWQWGERGGLAFGHPCGQACPSSPAMAPGGNGLVACPSGWWARAGQGTAADTQTPPGPVVRPEPQQTKQGVLSGVLLATGTQVLCLGPGAGATSEQTSHCARPERSPSRASR